MENVLASARFVGMVGGGGAIIRGAVPRALPAEPQKPGECVSFLIPEKWLNVS